MKNAILLHGIDESRDLLMRYSRSPSNSHWFPWLQWELVKAGILLQTPEMPNPYLPDMNYEAWTKVFKQFEIDKDSILIGHSCGGGYLLKYLSMNPHIEIGHLILVAPWLDIDREHPTFFADFELDANLRKRIKQIDLFYSADDMDIIIKSVAKIKAVYGNDIVYHEFANKGHFCEDEIGTIFPELLQVILA